MKYLGFILLASLSLAQRSLLFMTQENLLIEQTYNGTLVLRTCFGTDTHVDCIGFTSGNVASICNTYNYRNGKKESPYGDCCYNSDDCKGTCNNLVCV